MRLRVRGGDLGFFTTLPSLSPFGFYSFTFSILIFFGIYLIIVIYIYKLIKNFNFTN